MEISRKLLKYLPDRFRWIYILCRSHPFASLATSTRADDDYWTEQPGLQGQYPNHNCATPIRTSDAQGNLPLSNEPLLHRWYLSLAQLGSARTQSDGGEMIWGGEGLPSVTPKVKYWRRSFQERRKHKRQRTRRVVYLLPITHPPSTLLFLSRPFGSPIPSPSFITPPLIH